MGDWLEIQYSYTNPGGWQRDDAGAEVDWNLGDNPLKGVYQNCRGVHSDTENGYVDCGILATPTFSDTGHAWGGGLRYANKIKAGRPYLMNVTLFEGPAYNDGGKYWWNLGGQETQPCENYTGTCVDICPNNNPICMFAARTKGIIKEFSHDDVEIPRPGVLQKSWNCRPGIPEEEECSYR